jgi:fermentation-respiration switch protein FrsA (DUF1100 family)
LTIHLGHTELIRRPDVKKWMKIALITVAAILAVVLIAIIGLFIYLKPVGEGMVTNPYGAEERVVTESPADYGLPYEEVWVTTEDGFDLVGWYVPSQNGAVIIAQHGYKGNRQNMLPDAERFYRHGYGVLISTVRAHDESDGEVMSVGVHEMKDLEAWYQYLLTRDDIDHDKIAIFGSSMGGMLVIQYAAQNDDIQAIATHSAFSSLKDTVEIIVELETGFRWPFSTIIGFWAERTGGFRTNDIDSTLHVGKISPRPIFLMMGGQDDHVSTDCGHVLLEAAGEPKELWFEPDAGHSDLDELCPAKYETCVIGFYDEYLLGEPGVECGVLECS